MTHGAPSSPSLSCTDIHTRGIFHGIAVQIFFLIQKKTRCVHDKKISQLVKETSERMGLASSPHPAFNYKFEGSEFASINQ